MEVSTDVKTYKQYFILFQKTVHLPFSDPFSPTAASSLPFSPTHFLLSRPPFPTVTFAADPFSTFFARRSSADPHVRTPSALPDPPSRRTVHCLACSLPVRPSVLPDSLRPIPCPHATLPPVSDSTFFCSPFSFCALPSSSRESSLCDLLEVCLCQIVKV